MAIFASMRKWWIVIFSLVTLLLAGASIAPWLAYWIGLTKIEGRPVRPVRDVRDVTAEELDRFCKQLRISQPCQVDQLSPYSYLLHLLHSLQGDRGSAGPRIAWIVARSHNAKHLDDRRYWHLSGAALIIWLTRNWTSSELIARAIELENSAAAARSPR